MSNFDEKTFYETNESVKIGNYVCGNCPDTNNQSVVFIEKNGDKLPDCPVCGHTLWTKF